VRFTVIALAYLGGITRAACGIGPAIMAGIGKFLFDSIHKGKGAFTAIGPGKGSDKTAALYLFLEAHRAGRGIGLKKPAFEKGKIGDRVSSRHVFPCFPTQEIKIL
jgi:hypothetical protein